MDSEASVTKEEIEKLLKYGMSMSDIAKRKGVSVETVRKRLNGIDGPRGRARRIDHDQVRKLRSEGKTYKQIAETVGCSPAYVQKLLT